MSASADQAYIALIQADPANPEVIPAAPLLQKVNFMGADLGTEIDTETSKNRRGDRRTTDVVITGFEVGGGYTFEMTYENSLLDDLIEGFLWSSWVVDTIIDGEAYTPFFIERGHPDVGEFFQFMGMGCSVWSMTFADQASVTGEYQFIGLNTAVIQTPTIDATYTEATSNPVFSGITNITDILIDGVATGACEVKEWTIEINNNLTAKTGVGKKGACATNAHKLSITGDITMYFSDSAMYQRLLTGTAFSFGWTMADNDGNAYAFRLPKVKLDTDEIPIDEGDDSDVMDNASYVALYDETEGCMIEVIRAPKV